MPEEKIPIGVLISGGGSNLQAIIDAARAPLLERARVAVVISNKAGAYGLERARKAGIDALALDPKDFPSRTDYFSRIISELEDRRVRVVCLAGFLLKLEPNIVARYSGRILNIHPALLPKFGGKGMYGHFVHEAVLRAGEKESGCTVHVVDAEFDHGPVLLQRKVPVLPGDTPETLAERVLKEEHACYPEAIALLLRGHNT
ncbi:MAG: phosphoribosylglycinamide formyltransferase [Elusimicrobia bacterium RIFCSPHIGHO2_01_FULL_64_10]|nr:MAG: phosphoribosylglycinamide formyltransferase [Elusimicrobia bacterium RIFCSPHIGHO2_01_FULL_64_10]